MSQPSSAPADHTARSALRQHLLAKRRTFVQSADWAGASSELSTHLLAVLQQIEPQCLGIYWAVQSEFDPVPVCLESSILQMVPLALPFASKATGAKEAQMHYRAWDRQTPRAVDECGIPTASGPKVEPDVVLVPCLGFNCGGFRLGYGGGYFDRYLKANPGVTAIGLACADAKLSSDQWEPQAHDVPLTLILTQNGVVA